MGFPVDAFTMIVLYAWGRPIRFIRILAFCSQVWTPPTPSQSYSAYPHPEGYLSWSLEAHHQWAFLWTRSP